MVNYIPLDFTETTATINTVTLMLNWKMGSTTDELIFHETKHFSLKRNKHSSLNNTKHKSGSQV